MKNTIFPLPLILFILFVPSFGQSGLNEDYLSWTASQAEQVGKAMRENGKAGSSFDFRIINTDHAINYKLRATLLTPEVIRAAARIEQLKNRLSVAETKKLVEDAENAGDLVVLVEIDPREGSGVIPLDWRVFLQTKGYREGSGISVSGIKSPQLRQFKGLSGVFKRDYNYDAFWVVFPLVNEKKEPIFPADLSEIELFVGIYAKEGRVTWKMPQSLRDKIKKLSQK